MRISLQNRVETGIMRIIWVENKVEIGSGENGKGRKLGRNRV